jgi:hypothetical protein
LKKGRQPAWIHKVPILMAEAGKKQNHKKKKSGNNEYSNNIHDRQNFR